MSFVIFPTRTLFKFDARPLSSFVSLSLVSYAFEAGTDESRESLLQIFLLIFKDRWESEINWRSSLRERDKISSDTDDGTSSNSFFSVLFSFKFDE